MNGLQLLLFLKKLSSFFLSWKMLFFAGIIVCAYYIVISSTTVDDETPDEKTKDTKIGMVIVGIILGIVIIGGIWYSLEQTTPTELTAAPINPDVMCYIWFGLIYVGIWFTIISIIIKVSNMITTDTITGCAIIPNYTKQYYEANPDGVNPITKDKTSLQGLAPIFDFRYNRIDSIKFSYASKNKVKMFPPQKNPPTKPTTTNDYNNVINNIQSIDVTYWNIMDPTIKRTCTISDNYSICLILGGISQVPARTPGENKDEYPYTCSAGN